MNFFYAESGESDTLKDSDFMKITRDDNAQRETHRGFICDFR